MKIEVWQEKIEHLIPPISKWYYAFHCLFSGPTVTETFSSGDRNVTLLLPELQQPSSKVGAGQSRTAEAFLKEGNRTIKQRDW